MPTCRQPGRLSTSSSQAWPDASMPANGAGGGGFVAAAAVSGQAVAEAAGGMEEDNMEVAAGAAADGVVEMRQSSTG